MEPIPVLRLAIDPQLEHEFAPEIHWVWRLLLSTSGWGWQAVSPDAPCDVAWVRNPGDAPRAKLIIRADAAAWAQPSKRLAGLSRSDSLVSPVFVGEAGTGEVAAAENGQVICHRDVIFDVFWLATGQEEPAYPTEKHGYKQLAGTVFHHEGVAMQALASQVAAWLEKTLLRLGSPMPAPRWPEGKKAAVAAGHDVDYPEVIRLIEPLRKVAEMGARGIRPALDVLTGQRAHWHFADWEALEQRMGVRSAFYFVPRQGTLLQYATGLPDPFYDVTSAKFRRLFASLRAEGFEVGLHASYRAHEDFDRFKREKELLEEASQGPVNGNRHHYWHMNHDSPEETLYLHERLGLEYDSSMVHDHYIGWRRGISHPYFPFHPRLRRELRTLQIPPAWMDDQLFSFRSYNELPEGRLATLKALAGRVAEQGGVLTVDVHDYVYDDRLFPEWRKTYQDLLAYLSERGDFWFTTPLEIARHWTQRYAGIRNASVGLEQGQAR